MKGRSQSQERATCGPEEHPGGETGMESSTLATTGGGDEW